MFYCQECMSYMESNVHLERRLPQVNKERYQRERGSLRLQETLRQVRFVSDCACCQRGWQGDAEDCCLEEGYVLPCGSPGEA